MVVQVGDGARADDAAAAANARLSAEINKGAVENCKPLLGRRSAGVPSGALVRRQ